METRVPPLHPESGSSSETGDTMGERAPSTAKSAMLEKFQALQKKRLDVKKQSIEDTEKEETRGKSGRGNRKRKSEDNQKPSSSEASTHSGGAGEEGWSDIKPYLDVNSHLKGIDKGRHAAKTKLEEEIDDAVARGDLETAEELSDQLSTRDFGKKIADAIDAKRFDTKRQEQEEVLKAKRKKKLPWGFHHKERWEMKGNM